jgi:ketosteroid isomerase-like protein
MDFLTPSRSAKARELQSELMRRVGVSGDSVDRRNELALDRTLLAAFGESMSRTPTYEERMDLATRFHAALVARDWTGLRRLLTDDAQWVLPGDNTISGAAIGAEDVLARARQIARYELKFELNNLLLSRTDVALGLHNTAERDGVRLDEHLATVLRVRNGRVYAIETFLSNVDGMNRFFR